MTADRIAELVEGFDSIKEFDRSPLLPELRELGGVDASHELARSADPQERYRAARLMHLLPDPGHVGPLEALVADADQKVAAASRRALHGQLRTDAWRSLVTRLAEDTANPELSEAAAGWLAER